MTDKKHLGSLKAHFSVDGNGGAVYSIPLEVPPGTAGMMPSLAVVYNSGGGNGLLGVGWSLQGLSSITRTAATIAQDRFIGAVSYDANDRFALDGQRLVPVAGEYDGHDTVFHTEIESWRRIEPIYTQTIQSRSGPDSFRVTTRDGKLAEYGTSADAQIEASATNPSIRVWAMNKITDLNGNYLTVSYTKDPAGGGFYPARIDYTGNDAGLSPQRSVRFTYEPRPDHVPKYLGGYVVQFTQRLSKIETFLDDQLVMQYLFSYEQGLATGRSRLVSITQSDAQGIPLSPTLFQWQDAEAASFREARELDSLEGSFEGILLPMDVNGDGLVDLVRVYQGECNAEIDIMLATPGGAGFEPPVHVCVPGLDVAGTFLPMDVNGDGCIDLVNVQEDHTHLSLTVLTATFVDDHWTLVPGPIGGGLKGEPVAWSEPILAMDVDGDGRVDLVQPIEEFESFKLRVFFSNGTGFEVSDMVETNTTVGGPGRWIPMDYNGDGMTDLAFAQRGRETVDLTLFRSHGRKGLIQQGGNPLPESINGFGSLIPVDANGDGMTDLLHVYLEEDIVKMRLLLSNGVGFEPQDVLSTSVKFHGGLPVVLPMDLNGDGLTDIVVAESDGKKVTLNCFLSTGTDFVFRSLQEQPFSMFGQVGNLIPMDIDGNGKTDILHAERDRSSLSLAIAVAAGAFPDLLTTITNGLGGQIKTAYKPLTDPTVYSKADVPHSTTVGAQSQFNNGISGSTYPLPSTPGFGDSTPGAVYALQTVDFPKYVVSGYLKSDGRGSQYDYGYNTPAHGYFYKDARIDLSGRGWLGFEEISMHDNNLQTRTVTQYNQPFPLTATVASSLISRSGDRALMQRTLMEYQVTDSTPKSCQVRLREVTTDFYNFAAGQSADSTHYKTWEYDEFGNVSRTCVSSTEPESKPLYTFDTYLNDSDRWRLGYPIESKRASDAEGTLVLEWDQTTYDPMTMNKTSHKVWDDQNERWLVSTFGNDKYGNRTSTTDPAGAVTSKTYDGTYHSFVVETKSGPNQNGDSLIAAFDHYPQFGITRTTSNTTLSSSANPGQIIAQRNIDGLGRVIATLGPDPSNNLVALTRSSVQQDKTGVYKQTLALMDWKEPTWAWSRDYLDGMGRAYKTVSLGPDGKTPVIVDKTLDSRGKVVHESLPYFEGNKPIFIDHTYDNYERLVEEVKPGDGALIKTTRHYTNSYTVVVTEGVGSPNERKSVTEYSTFKSRRRAIRRTDASGAITTYSYDPMGRLLSSTDSGGVVNNVAYDSLGRQIRVEATKSGETQLLTSYSYDDVRNTAAQVTLSGRGSTVSYDGLKRPISKTIADQRPTIFRYDDSNRTNSIGRLSSVEMPDGSSYEYDYTPYGDRLSTTLTLNSVSYQFKRDFGPARNVLHLIYPDGSAVVNGYNQAGQLVSVAPESPGSGDPEYFATFDRFTPSGKVGQVTYGNSTQDSLGYNGAEQLKSTVLRNPDRTSVNNVFQWNSLNELESIGDLLDPKKDQAFLYDAVGRLVQATGDFRTPQEFAYDSAGNLTLKDGISYEYDGYRVTEGSQGAEKVFSASYDLDGNMTTATTLNEASIYEYDEENRLIKAGSATFAYDFTGRRLMKSVADGPTTYYISHDYEVVVFPDGSSQRTRYLVTKHGLIASITRAGSDRPAVSAQRFAGVPGPGTSYFHRNRINSTTVVSDSQGDFSSRIDYLPYGEINSITGADTFRQKFTGQELDDETGLYYFQARYYDPRIGRFITADDRIGGPLRRRDVFNRYAYVLNNPVTGIDPTGHGFLSDIGDFGHFFSSDIPHFFDHTVKGFFTDDLKVAFANKIDETILSYTLDGALIVGGVALIALSPFGGPASTVLGSTLLGAGIAGLSYNLTHQNWSSGTVSGDFSWGDYFANVGIGAATGLIAGGVGAGADVLVSAASEGEVAAFAVGGQGRFLVNVAAGVIGNSAGGFVGQIATNALEHHSLFSDVGFATVAGGLLGGLGAGASEFVATSLATRFSVPEFLQGLSDEEYERAFEDENVINAIYAKADRLVLKETAWTRTALASPGIFFSGVNALIGTLST